MTLSVVIPTHNRRDQLLRCLDSLARQERVGTSVEVVLVLDGCTDDTRAAIASVKFPFIVRVLEVAKNGPAAARNVGWQIASGDICLFLDDDITAEPRLLASHVALHQARSRVVGIGHLAIRVRPDSGPMLRWYVDGWRIHFQRFASGNRPNWADCYAGNLSAPTCLLREVGGFASDMPTAHDAELGYRLALAGATFEYLAEAAGTQHEDRSSRELAARLERSGAAWITLYERHPGTLPDLLGTYQHARRREVCLRNLLLRFNVSVNLLEKVGYLLPSEPARRSWYAFLRRYCSWRGVRRAVPRALWSRITGRTVILLYHAFAQPGERPSRFVISGRRFALQIRVLRLLGYSIMPFEEYVHLLRTHQLPPGRTAIITFDDGYVDTMEVALPILRRLAVPAAVFVVTQKLGRTNDWTEGGPLKERRLLAATAVKELAHAGIAVGSHSCTHPSLSVLTIPQAHDEMISSRNDLQTLLGQALNVLAFPFGDWNDAIRQLAEQSGYSACCTAEGGHNHLGTPRYALRRIEVDGTEGLFQFVFKVSAGLSVRRWLGRPHPN